MLAGARVHVRRGEAVVRLIIPPTDRSSPRVSTTTLCPTAAKTSGIDVFRSDVQSNAAGKRVSWSR